MKGNHPVDHGWAWVICFATGVQAYFVVGGLKSMGVLFVTLVEKFEAQPSVTSLTLGLVAGGFAVFAILSNAVALMIGFRKVVVFGAALCTFSAFMAMWAMNIYYVIIFLGLLSGLAYGAMATPAVVLLNFYFDERKSLANGLAMVGSSIGQLSLPYLLTYFIQEYGFRGAMLLYTGVCMQAIPAALLLRPTEFWTPKKKSGKKQKKDLEKSNKNETEPLNKNLEVVKSDVSFAGSLPSLHSRVSADKVSKNWSTVSLKGSRSSLRPSKHSTLHDSTGSIMLGLSVEDLAGVHETQDETDENHVEETQDPPTKKPNFFRLMCDVDLLRSPTFYMLFCSVGIGHAGFIDACLFLPSLAYELFSDKYKGAMLIAVIGAFDIGGRIGGGWFADLGFIRRTHLTGIAMISTGVATFVSMFYPVLPVLIAYSIVMGLLGGVYRILLPVLVRDLFGPAKISAGVAMAYLSLGTFILPMPIVMGYMKEVYGTYIPTMMLCGCLLIFGSVLMFLIPLVQKYENKKRGTFTPEPAVNPEPDGTKDPENISIVLEPPSEASGHEKEKSDLGKGDHHKESKELTEQDITDVKV